MPHLKWTPYIKYYHIVLKTIDTHVTLADVQLFRVSFIII